jgi:hypothetical protein
MNVTKITNISNNPTFLHLVKGVRGIIKEGVL